MGRRGYVRRVHDAKTDRPVWTPTSEGAPVMLAMHKVYGKSILNGSALARHLNTKNIRTITGRRFAPNMMTALLRHLERLAARNHLTSRRTDHSPCILTAC